MSYLFVSQSPTKPNLTSTDVTLSKLRALSTTDYLIKSLKESTSFDLHAVKLREKPPENSDPCLLNLLISVSFRKASEPVSGGTRDHIYSEHVKTVRLSESLIDMERSPRFCFPFDNHDEYTGKSFLKYTEKFWEFT